MSLLRLQEISLKFGKREIFKSISFTAELQERICLIGRNGAGKTTFLKLLNKELTPDSGETHLSDNLRLGILSQSLIEISNTSVFDFLKEGLKQQQQTITKFEELSEELKQQPKNKELLEKIHQVQGMIEAGGGWDLDFQVQQIGDRLQVPLHKKLTELSGGWLRKVAIAKVFINNPNLLLLDEPTNHLDINSIDWLEKTLTQFTGCVIFITHDRTFLRNIATRIIEIDRANLISFEGNYDNYLIKKEELNLIEDKELSLFSKRLDEEEAWIRKGVKARRTRNEGRVRQLEKMREDSDKLVKRSGKVTIHITEAEKSGKKIIEAHNISHKFGEETIIKDFSIKISRGQRIGIVGNNGVGKSTLLRILLGSLTPQTGTIKQGENLHIAYLDQIEHKLKLDKSIADNIGDGSTYVDINGKPRHVVGYMKNFLFTPESILNKVSILSGGEKNRVALAKLLVRPSNVLVLDEPTNDLDIELIEVIEEQLNHYNGTLIIVSHDRDFLDQCVNQIIVFEEKGIVVHQGGYDDWKSKGRTLKIAETLQTKSNPNKTNKKQKKEEISNSKEPEIPIKKLSYNNRKELRSVLKQIDNVEKKVATILDEVKSKTFYLKSYEEQKPIHKELKQKQDRLENLMTRWQELEN